MKVQECCRNCLKGLARKTVDLSGGDEALFVRCSDLIDELFSGGATPPGISNEVLASIKRETGAYDPYCDIKAKELVEARLARLRKGLQGKALPGSPDRDARLAMLLTDALPPRINDQTEERGTFEDWITWGVYNLANGHTTWATEIKPEGTVDALYDGEVVNVVSSLPRMAPAMEPDPETKESGIGLVEITEGVILSIGRETGRRLY